MFQDIAPHRLNKEYCPDTTPSENDIMVVIKGRRLLLKADQEGQPVAEMTYADFQQIYPEPADDVIFLHKLDDRSVFGCAVDGDAPEGYVWATLRDTMYMPVQSIGFAVATGAHLMQWYDSHRYCGRCRTKMIRPADERAVMCPTCKDRTYPTICPVVIVPVTNGNKLLMTRYKAANAYRRLALVAGFCEYGESLEEAVAREVWEEAGLRVKNFKYFGSQPWPMSSSLIAGIFAEVDGDDTITVNADGKDELSEAIWVEREDIRDLEDTLSITRVMINAFKNGQEPK